MEGACRADGFRVERTLLRLKRKKKERKRTLKCYLSVFFFTVVVALYQEETSFPARDPGALSWSQVVDKGPKRVDRTEQKILCPR